MLPLFSDAVHAISDAATPIVLAAADGEAPDTQGLADWLRGFFGPLFLVIVSIVAIFFLFTREITRFAQFVVLAIFIGIVFYVPNVIETLATAIARAMGVEVAE
ncbi:hypothetical protein [Nocardiopsis composta]|uniref:Uncharacterized protein n=1 Tax=Nocardiopsis composta TaxID=157465 RepID=A0A7W8QRH2_9ACTN|nr:hypothetical protein [Nocardiopsis composta]MBB5434580.1 hypothetical protein [Nocardiopsis composta]